MLLFARVGHGVNIFVLTQSSCAAFCSCSLLQLEAVPIPACRLFDMSVLMSSSHMLLIFQSPQVGKGCGRMTIVQILFIHVCQWKNDTC
jgi:hypothetical protein